MVRGAAWSDGGDGVPVPYLVCGAAWPDDVDSVPVPHLVRGAAWSDDGDGVPVPYLVRGAAWSDDCNGVPVLYGAAELVLVLPGVVRGRRQRYGANQLKERMFTILFLNICTHKTISSSRNVEYVGGKNT
jgi:hypothetical protein